DLPAVALAHDQLGMGNVEVVAKSGPVRTLDAVVGPKNLRAISDGNRLVRPAAGMLGGEGLVTRRMPVLGQDHVAETPRQPVDDRHHLVAARHGERAARTEVVLDVDNDENVAFPGGDALGHGAAPSTVARRRSVSSARACSDGAIVTGYAG